MYYPDGYFPDGYFPEGYFPGTVATGGGGGSGGATFGGYFPQGYFTLGFFPIGYFPEEGGVVATPSFDPTGGTFTENQTVTITVSTPGASIFYRVSPSSTWLPYTTPVLVAYDLTLESYATLDSYDDSAVQSEDYVITTQASLYGYSALQIANLVRQNVQIFGVEPLFNGFTDETEQVRTGGTIIADWINFAYYELVMLGFMQCEVYVDLVVGQSEYAMPPNVGYVYDTWLTDPDTGRHTPMGDTSRGRMNGETPYRRNYSNSRPHSSTIRANRLTLGRPPNKAYTYTILADVMPDQLVLTTDRATRLPALLHGALVAGGSYYIGRAAMNSPENRDSQGAQIRFAELKSDWGLWQTRVLEMSHMRNIPSQFIPMVDDYRLGLPFRR